MRPLGAGVRKKASVAAKDARYNASAKGRETRRRYRASVRGHAIYARNTAAWNRRRLRVGRREVGYAATEAEAAVINRHIKDRLHGFVESQRGDGNGHAGR